MTWPAPHALERAVDAGVVTLDGQRVRAAHPLLAAAAKRHAAEEETRNLHRGLAEVVADEQRRALHLALATLTPDEGLAARLDVAAMRAAARGGTRRAVDLASHALRLTPPESSDVDRVLARVGTSRTQARSNASPSCSATAWRRCRPGPLGWRRTRC